MLNIDHNSFSASTVHLDYITTALSCLMPFGPKDDVLVFIDKDGLSFTRQSNHINRIQLFLSKELFITYLFNHDDNFMRLSLKLSHLLNSVSVSSRQQLDDILECTFSYRGHGTPFMLIFQDSYTTEQVEYSTYLTTDADGPNQGLELDRSSIQLECIIQGDVLYTALKELREIGCKECYLYAKTDEYTKTKVFSFISKSKLGFSKIRLPSNRSIMEKLEVYNSTSTIIGFFDFNSIDKLRPSTKIASKVLLRLDAHGILSANILCQIDKIAITSSASTSEAPADYPGVVIEICMLEKEIIDSASKNEIEVLMRSSIKERTIDSYFTTTMADPTTKENVALFEVPTTNRETNNEERNDKQHADIIEEDESVPMFF
ncbi:hypothetical protein TBLA_0A04350 [Henningerozyma blattae CBS 6284]|uniref:DNA damage checkpoint control protein RAD17 n=1 Tax=Henningerozyma blattae (strain ATCC 34711 / CBS 6284 / DSM 70876 / NBRC 10599 / NRRL Y-10934 / UCD 77-7) TaxID=1071380 RepID=I2GVS8_HENB6|nr:hypothetical protein TBLA_0A04350 [Tetrapisispora blattae CBS 6284]CCH58230.1 hypothetical protein TBLA_0A04350 [Tetrapisispora blattae CBS 6284]